MSLRPIIRFPDPALKTICLAVEEFDTGLRQLVDDLYDTMRAAPGVGITASHIGVALRVVVLDLAEIGGRRDYVNPEILWFSPETMEHTEGSVSMPGATETVTRPRAIDIRYRDLDGAVREERLEGFPAICMQHEVDQLDGLFWLQRLSKLKRDRLVKKWEKSSR
ncbi:MULTISPECIES: peptide deformylase [Alphaproteobacteria]|uniref:Peptide deformylase-like n=2 Tax=Alphaproteobacteria TaxID=28211 RepID=A0A512HDA5_9HYPH|nr:MULTISPECIES: peptide deformylase [Alphaproteobacteria]GEO83431.1 peptide deformylase-like protein [Ciceribacter naphthalenivorans]GLR22996.1 peptide deformylase-like protein [Ciceribacter naphthalenivorans]GLT05852.1 peptide deformylase-like protein [Sphingomonas psychrolutea]